MIHSQKDKPHEVLEFAGQAGAGTLREPSHGGGLNVALAWAIETLAAGPAVLILLPDTPLVSPSELMELTSGASARGPSEAVESANQGSSARAIAVPDRAGRGTNALLLSPPSLMPLTFGPRSLARHGEAARISGAIFSVHHLPGIALDLDTAADVADFLRKPSDTRTRWFVTDLQIPLALERQGAGVSRLPSSARTPRIVGANSQTER
jgi:2-phospho-L-lactate guanylyltransferase